MNLNVMKIQLEEKYKFLRLYFETEKSKTSTCPIFIQTHWRGTAEKMSAAAVQSFSTLWCSTNIYCTLVIITLGYTVKCCKSLHFIWFLRAKTKNSERHSWILIHSGNISFTHLNYFNTTDGYVTPELILDVGASAVMGLWHKWVRVPSESPKACSHSYWFSHLLCLLWWPTNEVVEVTNL